MFNLEYHLSYAQYGLCPTKNTRYSDKIKLFHPGRRAEAKKTVLNLEPVNGCYKNKKSK